MYRTMIILFLTVMTVPAWGHDGRRFEVKVVDDQLAAHGYISNGIDDGGCVIRPYCNSLHGHWTNNPTPGVTAASTDLPGYDVLGEADPLIGYDLVWTLTGARKWSNPVVGGPVVFEDLEPAEEIFVTFGASTVSTGGTFGLGSLTLLDVFTGSNGQDIDLAYDIGLEPSGVLYVLESTLSTSAPDVLDSGTIFTILSPEGALHHESLYLESELGNDLCPSGDQDGDGIANSADVCPCSAVPAGVDADGRPLGDVEPVGAPDCDVDLRDFSILQQNLSGPR